MDWAAGTNADFKDFRVGQRFGNWRPRQTMRPIIGQTTALDLSGKARTISSLMGQYDRAREHLICHYALLLIRRYSPTPQF